MRLLATVLALPLLAASPISTLQLELPADMSPDASGRLLVFVEPATVTTATHAAVDIGMPDAPNVSVASMGIARASRRTVTIEPNAPAYPTPFGELPAGSYRLQAVLDRNDDYAYSGRGPGDLLSKVITVDLPLRRDMTIPLDDVVPPAPGQFETVGLPPAAAAQIAASRAHLNDELIASTALTRFHHSPQAVRAWVLTPPGYDPAGRVTYPTVYTAGGFGTDHRQDGQQLSKIWHLMETGAIRPMIWVALDYATSVGTTEFANSANNGPWGDALVRDVIPALERRYRMDARPSGRFLTGHSSGGWFALWTMVTYPTLFGGCWSTSPDPVDFTDFLGVDLSVANANMFRSANGTPRPLERDGGEVRQTIEGETKLEEVLARDGNGGQLRSFEWAFSPRGPDGQPKRLFNRHTGVVDPVVAAYWREHYDIAHKVEADWPSLRHGLDSKVHVRVGAEDSFYLDGAVRRLDAAFRKVGGHAVFNYVTGASHSMAQVYAEPGDRNAYWKTMSREMDAIARPMSASSVGKAEHGAAER